jgi:protein associated with RNAse G/E
MNTKKNMEKFIDLSEKIASDVEILVKYAKDENDKFTPPILKDIVDNYSKIIKIVKNNLK